MPFTSTCLKSKHTHTRTRSILNEQLRGLEAREAGIATIQIARCAPINLVASLLLFGVRAQTCESFTFSKLQYVELFYCVCVCCVCMRYIGCKANVTYTHIHMCMVQPNKNKKKYSFPIKKKFMATRHVYIIIFANGRSA